MKQNQLFLCFSFHQCIQVPCNSSAALRRAAISNGRFHPVKSISFTALRWAGVIGMQVSQVAKMPVECFVNGQLCMSTSEPISHSKLWHHVKPPPNHSFVMRFKKQKKALHTVQYLGAEVPFFLYSDVWFPLLADGCFPADRIRNHFLSSLSCAHHTIVLVKNKDGRNCEICSIGLQRKR